MSHSSTKKHIEDKPTNTPLTPAEHSDEKPDLNGHKHNHSPKTQNDSHQSTNPTRHNPAGTKDGNRAHMGNRTR
jgi:hypothetical protein